jgi:two-component system, NarL family, sensor histidine kinase DesK
MAADDDLASCQAADQSYFGAGGLEAGGRRPSLVGSGLSGQRRGGAIRWFFSGIWLVYLIQPVADLSHGHHHPLWIAGGVVLAVVFCAVYIAILASWESHPRRAYTGLAVIVALAVAAGLIYGQAWTAMWIYISAATGFVFPGRRRALLAVAVVGGCYALLSLISHVPETTFLFELLPVVLVGWAMVGFRLQLVLMHELRQARETVAKLAVNEERLRLARDMHDLTGQSLSLITLKSELAAKRIARLPQSAELDAVLTEVTDIGRVSRQTLHDIREAVSGYRRPTLAIEIITARTSMDAAGIHVDDDPALTMRSGTFDPDAEAALAWCLREAATNVTRHSGAASCRVRLTERSGEISLEVSDDGRGLSAPSRALPAGTGLHGMLERLSAVGGRFSVESTGRDGRGFRLIATVPAGPAPQAAAPATDAATTEPPTIRSGGR